MTRFAALMLTLGLVTASALGAQAGHPVTVRAGVGPTTAYGGAEEMAKSGMASFGLDVRLRDFGSSTLMADFAFGYYYENGDGLTLMGCGPDRWCNGRPFPVNFRTASIGLGWRGTTGRFSTEAGFQPTAFTSSYPTRWAFGLGARTAVGVRLVGPVGFEVATAGAYTPSYRGDRFGVHDVTFGLRTW